MHQLYGPEKNIGPVLSVIGDWNTSGGKESKNMAESVRAGIAARSISEEVLHFFGLLKGRI